MHRSILPPPPLKITEPPVTPLIRFGGFKGAHASSPPMKGAIRAPGMESLMDLWESYLETDRGMDPYLPASTMLYKSDFSPEAVQRFLDVTVTFQEMQDTNPAVGYFLSAMMNEGKTDSYSLWSAGVPISSLCFDFGFKGRKSVIMHGHVGSRFGEGFSGRRGEIYGNAGDELAKGMDCGLVWLHGNAGDRAARKMSGGRLIIDGSCGDELGRAMGDGIVIVKGDAGMKVGEKMDGGAIRVLGGIGGIGDVISGQIYHKGELIVDL
jgi:hypothetical protein